MREITDQTFEAEVMQAERPVVIDFWAPWCGPCKAVEPVLADLADRHAGRVEFVKLNIDENPVVASRYDVLATNLLIVFPTIAMGIHAHRVIDIGIAVQQVSAAGRQAPPRYLPSRRHGDSAAPPLRARP